MRTSGKPSAQASAGHEADPQGSNRSVLSLTIGALSLAFGIVLLVLPNKTLLLVALLFGVQLIVLGVVRIVLVVSASALPRWVKIAGVVMGILTIVAGGLCFFRPSGSLLVIAILLAAGWIADGVADIARGVGRTRSSGEVLFLILSGIASVGAGLVVALNPHTSLVLLTQVVGVLLILLGVAWLVRAFVRGRSKV